MKMKRKFRVGILFAAILIISMGTAMAVVNAQVNSTIKITNEEDSPRKLSDEEAALVKQKIMNTLLEKVKQNPDKVYRVMVQVWDNKAIEELKSIDVIERSNNRYIINAKGNILKEVLKDKLKGKYNNINLITQVPESSKTSTNKTNNFSYLSPMSTERSFKFAGGISPPNDCDDWWSWNIGSNEDRIKIDSHIYDILSCDVDLTLYDPSLNFIDDDTYDSNGLYIMSYTNGVSGNWQWQYWGQFLDTDGTGYSGISAAYDD
jgi:phosphoribosylanthranilate isomerase